MGRVSGSNDVLLGLIDKLDENVIKLACLWNLSFRSDADDEQIQQLQPFALGCVKQLLGNDEAKVESFIRLSRVVGGVARSVDVAPRRRLVRIDR